MIDQKPSTASSDVAVDPVHLRRSLAREVTRVLAGRPEGEGPRVARIEVHAEGVDALHWLHTQPSGSKLYWSGRDDDEAVAAIGVADVLGGAVLPSYESLSARLAPLMEAGGRDLRYYGGLRFDLAGRVEEGWAPFGAYRFVLPRFELRVRNGRARLLCNLVLPRDRGRRMELLAQINHLRFPAAVLGQRLALPLSRTDAPDRAGWVQKVNGSLEAFEQGLLDKVVLARRARFGFPHALDPVVLLQHLQAATPGCFHFLVGPGEGTAFVGASPERLFRRVGRAVHSEAVAGTRPRGASVLDDARLRQELLASEKDQREHAYVRRSIRESLATLCTDLYVDEEATTMALARGRHLLSGVQGTLRPDVTDFDVLQALHPTPAVGGYPKAEALTAIRDLEPFDRGWYAGPVGWVGGEGAEFAVAIRSGLVRGAELALYSGAGIVPGSTPEAEWEEIEHKISDFINVLGLDLQRAKY